VEGGQLCRSVLGGEVKELENALIVVEGGTVSFP